MGNIGDFWINVTYKIWFKLKIKHYRVWPQDHRLEEKTRLWWSSILRLTSKYEYTRMNQSSKMLSYVCASIPTNTKYFNLFLTPNDKQKSPPSILVEEQWHCLMFESRSWWKGQVLDVFYLLIYKEIYKKWLEMFSNCEL